MKKFGCLLIVVLMLAACVSSAFAIDSYIFPTDVLKQGYVGATAGYDFGYGARKINFPEGTYDYSETVNQLILDAQVGIGYGLQAGVASYAVPSTRVINDHYSDSPGRKYVFDHSGIANPTFSLRFSPVELLALPNDIGIAIDYAFKPGNWGSSHLSDHGYDTHTVATYGSLVTGPFRTYLGWVGNFNDAANFRESNSNEIAAGTEYNFSKSLAFTVDSKAGFVGSSTTTGEHRIANIDFGTQYAVVRNVFVRPFIDVEYVENYRYGHQALGDLFYEEFGVVLRAIF
ncbi:MAG: hypothetical protein P4L44_09140 [Oryzomonas sp.]|uniref:hypothetical protein n=1 Tax=Oryzomonas sp. TaxID=2855186 RepID=UPI00284105DF|nr:hypothetical protein [Oryzomonas sp.]MDR3580113.1 hypothetical protein [Oryzomonas sp.]